MEMFRRVTQQDVARAAGVNRATVSLALRDHPDLPLQTRDRIKRIAEKLGYVADPMMAALASYRKRLGDRGFVGTLAWLADSSRYDWRVSLHYSEYFAAAEKRARFHGHKVEVFDVGRSKMTWARASAIAEARGIRGVLVCPQPRANTDLQKFAWDKFSAVTFGYSVVKPALHSVAAAQFQAAMNTMEHLLALGYRRIGFSTIHDHRDRHNHNTLAGYLAAQYKHNLPKIPACIGDTFEEPALLDWIGEQRLDALMTSDANFFNRTITKKLRVPDELGVACPGLASPHTRLAGIWEENARIADEAVDMLVAMMQLGERGVPQHVRRLLVEGTWTEGASLRSQR